MFSAEKEGVAVGRIYEIHNLITKKEISCRELTQKYLEAVIRDNHMLGAYVNITAEQALMMADEVDRRIHSGEDIHPLCGVPMTLKDNICTKGIETTCCSQMLKGHKPVYDATVWQRLKALGAVLVGKTNMDEFAMGNTCETSCFGAAKNPHDTSRVAGGSSGGGACAVSANLAVYALGSDTGGSVRQPASFCGLVGLKPTYGAVSRQGLIAYASSLDQIGTLTTSVEDCALLFDSISFHDPLDSTSNTGYKADTCSSLNNSIKGRKLCIPQEYLEGLSTDVKTCFEKAVRTYEDMGAEIEYMSIPQLRLALPAYYILACAEASSNLGRYDGVRYGHKTDLYENVQEMVSKSRSEGFGDEVKRRILMGTYVLSEGYVNAYYKKAQAMRHELAKAFDRVFEEYDAILTPTVPHTAPFLGQALTNPVESYQSDICTVPVNIASLPAVSLPCGADSHGLPVGLQIIGNRFCEDTILNLAYKFQQSGDYVSSTDWGVTL